MNDNFHKNPYQSFDLRGLFNGIFPPGLLMSGYADKAHPLVPTAHEDYVFAEHPTREIIMFLDDPDGEALFIAGPTGCGKTSCVTEIAARLHWPVQSVTARGRLEFADLVGHHALTSPAPGEAPVMRFQYGPLAKAMAFGHIFVLNEADLMDPAELSGMNDILEGRPLVIEQNGGEVIKPHPMFRFIATGNSVGSGDAEGLYAGVQTQNIAAMDRYRLVLADYPAPAVETAILTKLVPELECLAEKMVAVANDIRREFKGEGAEGRRLGVTLSTRKLCRWAKLAAKYRGSPAPLRSALELTLLNRCADEERSAITHFAKLRFGDAWPESDANERSAGVSEALSSASSAGVR